MLNRWNELYPRTQNDPIYEAIFFKRIKQLPTILKRRNLDRLNTTEQRRLPRESNNHHNNNKEKNSGRLDWDLNTRQTQTQREKTLGRRIGTST
jgi:hypothetical protein